MKTLSLASFLAFTALTLSLRAEPNDPVNPPPASVTIPLQTILLPGGTYRLGLTASIGGGTPETYLLDTGSFGLFSAWVANATWWGNFTPTGDSGNVGYVSGLNYAFSTVTTNVTLGGNPVVTAQNVHVGLITNVTINGTVDTAFYDALEDGQPPEAGHFYGTLGSGLSSVTGGGGLYAMVAQLPGNLASGFIIHTGGPGGKATLTVGLTPALRKQFAVQIPMQGANTSVTFPNSGYPTYSLSLFNGTLAVTSSNSSIPPYSGSLAIIFDTGDPNGVIYNDGNFELPANFTNNNNNFLISGENLTLAALPFMPVIDPLPGDDLPFAASSSSTTPQGWSWSLTTGNLTGINQISLSPTPPASGHAAINTGITPFFYQDIMFDLQNGVVGFKKIVPSAYTQIVADAVTTPIAAATQKITGITRSSDNVINVIYSVNRGPYKKALGTAKWNFTASLKEGINTIVVKATSAKGITASQQLSITLTPTI